MFVPSPGGFLPLHAAADVGSLQCMHLLLVAGAALQLHGAVDAGALDAAARLLVSPHYNWDCLVQLLCAVRASMTSDVQLTAALEALCAPPVPAGYSIAGIARQRELIADLRQAMLVANEVAARQQPLRQQGEGTAAC